MQESMPIAISLLRERQMGIEEGLRAAQRRWDAIRLRALGSYREAIALADSHPPQRIVIVVLHPFIH
jgi:hypothetical protein